MLLKDRFDAPLTDVNPLGKGKQVQRYFHGISSNSRRRQGKIIQLPIEKGMNLVNDFRNI